MLVGVDGCDHSVCSAAPRRHSSVEFPHLIEPLAPVELRVSRVLVLVLQREVGAQEPLPCIVADADVALLVHLRLKAFLGHLEKVASVASVCDA